MILAALLAGAALAAGDPVLSVFTEIDALVASRPAKDAREIRADDRRIESMYERLRPLGARAVPGLAALALESARPPKSRFWAVNFLGRTKDPSALPALRAALAETQAPDYLRGEAASAIAGLRLPAHARRETLCAAIDPKLPPAVMGQLLAGAAALGCPSAEPLLKAAKALGSRPRGIRARFAASALRGLERTAGPSGARALLELAEFYAAGEPPRLSALARLRSRGRDLRLLLPDSSKRLCRLLSEASREPAEATAAAVLLSGLKDRDCAPVLRRLLSHPDGELVVSCAEALAAAEDSDSRAPLRALIEGAHADPRFAAAAGPALLTRLEKALVAIPVED